MFNLLLSDLVGMVAAVLAFLSFNELSILEGLFKGFGG
jgi:hypothetical protein